MFFKLSYLSSNFALTLGTLTHLRTTWPWRLMMIDEANYQVIRGTTQIWVVRCIISMEFLHLFLRCHFRGKPVVALPSDCCYLRLDNKWEHFWKQDNVQVQQFPNLVTGICQEVWCSLVGDKISNPGLNCTIVSILTLIILLLRFVLQFYLGTCARTILFCAHALYILLACAFSS